MRKDLGLLFSFANGNLSKRKKNKLNKIKSKHLVHSRYNPNNSTIEEIIDTVKQKLTRIADKLRRYVKSYNRKISNNLFINDEKRFYNQIKNNNTTNYTNPLQRSDIEEYWKAIWEKENHHNNTASWLSSINSNTASITEMPTYTIEPETFQKAITKLHNWKQPGPDKIHNFYYKYITILHQPLLRIINTYIDNPFQINNNISQGITYLKPKSTTITQPSQFRPITCLNTGYKLFTSCITMLINEHCHANDIIAIEQKGCGQGTKGCKDQLIIDSIITNQALKNKKNMHAAFIDYQKAFDCIPHSWLQHVLRIYKIHPKIICCLNELTRTWKTQLSFQNEEGCILTNSINIKRGIYQGDSLSPLLFCLAMNPLSTLLKNSKLGYSLKAGDDNSKLSHCFYMDDLKVYANTKTNLSHLLKIVEIFSSDIQMQLGIDKCRTQNVSKGKLIVSENYTTETGEHIAAIKVDEYYKYLGILQNVKIDHTAQKKVLTAEFKSRLSNICRTLLNSRNITKAINTYAIPLLTYSFGIINWSDTDLKALDIVVRTTLTQHRYHHPNAAIERVHIPRRKGGRGIINIQILHSKQVANLKAYFLKQATRIPLYQQIAQADDHLTPLNLKSDIIINIKTIEQLESAWRTKIVHGRYPNEIEQENINLEHTHNWLKIGYLYPETEGTIMAIQDGVICTRNYAKYIIRDPSIVSDNCRRCGRAQETMAHIINGCSCLAGNQYKMRHDLMGKVVYLDIVKKLELIAEETPYYIYQPPSTIENDSYKIYWDRTILTPGDTDIPNRPDMVIIDKINSNAVIIDFAIPLDSNITETRNTKINKYQKLIQYLKRTKHLNRIEILPIIISSTGTVPQSTVSALRKLETSSATLINMQKAVLLKTSSIVREFLGDN